MKAKHIISAVLLLVLPFALIIGFGELGAYLSKLASRTYMVRYIILGMLTSTIPIVVYIFWLSFVMRTKHRPARILLGCSSFTVAAALIVCVIFMLKDFFYGITIAIIAANLFAGIYMLCKDRKEKNITQTYLDKIP